MVGAILQIENTLGVSLQDAIFYKAEFAFNFALKHSPKTYAPIFGKHPNYDLPSIVHGSVYYDHKSKQFKFYDKGADMQAKKMKIPPLLQTVNIGRLEVKFKKNVKRQIGFNTIGELLDPRFYGLILDRWYTEYQNILKLAQYDGKWRFSSVSQMVNYGFNEWCQTKGYNVVYNLIEQEKGKGTISNIRMASRMRGRLNDSFKSTSTIEEESLIEELDQAVEYCYREAKMELEGVYLS
jgi:hypothetical protein